MDAHHEAIAPAHILSTPMLKNELGANTVREFLMEVLGRAWQGADVAIRDRVYLSLHDASLISGRFYWDGTYKVDRAFGDALVIEAVRSLAGGSEDRGTAVIDVSTGRDWIPENEVDPRSGKARAAVLRYPGGWYRAVVYGPGGGRSGNAEVFSTYEEAAREAMRMLIVDYPFDIKPEVNFVGDV